MTLAYDDIRQELDKAASVVATASRLLTQGRSVDLAALEGKVAGACEGIAALPADQARTLLPTLEELLTALDTLENDLKAQYAAGTGSAAGATPPPRAAAAYGKVQPPPRKAPPDPD